VGYGPEVDKAWREISYDGNYCQHTCGCSLINITVVGDQWISKSSLSKLEMPEYSVKANHPFTGEEGYRVGMEVFHQLHCLNLLRRVAYKDYYESLGGEFAAGPDALQHHAGESTGPKRQFTSINANLFFRSLYRGSSAEYSMHRGHWAIHLIHDRW
jgi:hypothetical protein